MVDLHMHSNISIDGELPPQELVQRCAQAKISTIALTDHNSTRGVTQARQAAKLHGIEVISGIELDCMMDNQNLHILGYGIDETDQRFADLESYILQQERYASGLRIELIRKCCGIQLDGAWLCRNAHNGVITGELIAEAALNDPENLHHPLMEAYLPGGWRSDNPYLNFYWDYCAQGKPAYVPIRYMNAQEAIELIHQCGGVAVLAHPGAGKGCGQDKILRLVHDGLEGIEVYSSYHSAEQIETYKHWAEIYDLLTTCGSDFHGKTKPAIELGKNLPCHANMAIDRLKQQMKNTKKTNFRSGGTAI